MTFFFNQTPCWPFVSQYFAVQACCGSKRSLICVRKVSGSSGCLYMVYSWRWVKLQPFLPSLPRCLDYSRVPRSVCVLGIKAGSACILGIACFCVSITPHSRKRILSGRSGVRFVFYKICQIARKGATLILTHTPASSSPCSANGPCMKAVSSIKTQIDNHINLLMDREVTHCLLIILLTIDK